MKNIEQEIKNKFNECKNKSRFCNLLNLEEKIFLKERTYFLPETSTNIERIFYIINNLYKDDIPKEAFCKLENCNNFGKKSFNFNEFKYIQTCCCLKHRSIFASQSGQASLSSKKAIQTLHNTILENGKTKMEACVEKRKETLKNKTNLDGTQFKSWQSENIKSYELLENGLTRGQQKAQNALKTKKNKDYINESGEYVSFCSEITKKGIETKRNNIDPETGLNSLQLGAKKAIETMRNTIYENGLNGIQNNGIRSAETMKNTIKDGLSTMQISKQKMVETKKKNINEFGLNVFQQSAIKSFLTTTSTILDSGLTVRQESDIKRIEHYKNDEFRKSKNWLLLSQMSDFEIYKRLCTIFTNKNKKYIKKPKHVKRNEYHLDHCYSVIEGFLNNIPPYIISSKTNLCYLTMKENISKGRKCSITLNELFEEIFFIS